MWDSWVSHIQAGSECWDLLCWTRLGQDGAAECCHSPLTYLLLPIGNKTTGATTWSSILKTLSMQVETNAQVLLDKTLKELAMKLHAS